MYSEAHIHRFYSQGTDAITRVIHRLEHQLEDAMAQLIREPAPAIALLTKELRTAKRTLARQTDELRHAHQLNHQLTRRIREPEHEIERGTQEPVPRDSPNSSLPPSLDLPWKKVKRTRSLRNKSGKKVGGQPGHPGKTLKPVPQPDHIVLHTPELCNSCGAALSHLGACRERRPQLFDLADGKVPVTEHRAQTLLCSACGASTTADFPITVAAPVQYGPLVISRAVYLNLYQLLPVARTCETMRDLFGCAISRATVQRAGLICSGKLVRSEQRLKAAIRDSAVIGADETGLRVGGGSGWVDVARTDELTHFAYDERRGKAAMDEIGILPQFRGKPSQRWLPVLLRVRALYTWTL